MFCSECGAASEDKDKFCRHCGSPLIPDANPQEARKELEPQQATHDSTPPIPILESTATTDKSFTESKPRASKPRGYWKVILLIVGALMLVPLVYAFYMASDGATSQKNASSTGDEFQWFTSTEHQFKALFEGAPEITRDEGGEGSLDIPSTSYSSKIDGTIQFTVTVYSYSTASSVEMAALDGVDHGEFLARFARTMNGTLVESRDARLGSEPAKEGKISIPWDGRERAVYMRVAKKDQRLYTVSTVDADRLVFDSIAGSFDFID